MMKNNQRTNFLNKLREENQLKRIEKENKEEDHQEVIVEVRIVSHLIIEMIDHIHELLYKLYKLSLKRMNDERD